MAKIRVYELARECNMTNKELLEKLQDMDISVKTHASSLDEEIVAKIKSILFGKATEKVVETRVRSTVIRRRKKIVAKKPAADGEPAEPDSDASDGLAEVPEEAEATVEETPANEETPPQEVPGDETPPVVKRKIDVEASPAKVIAAPEPPVSEPEGGPSAEEPTAKEVQEEAPETVEKTADEDTVEPSEKEAPASDEKEAAPASEDDQTDAPEKVPTAAKVPKKKKSKKEAPAKIIKKGEPPPEPDPKSQGTDMQGMPDPSGVGRRRGRKPPAGDDNRGFFKRKISFKRKEVVEGRDLYGKGRRGRKGKGPKGKSAKPAQKTQITTAKAIKRRIKIDENIILSDLAKRMGIKVSEIIVKLMGMGVMATMNQSVDFETANIVAAEFDYEVEKAIFEEEAIIKVATDDPEEMKSRPPVVTIMGHVDHGKTSLLDVIRQSRVTEGEAGGITQHIGAYDVKTDQGRVVFLDTPGHEAFTAMRARGASVTDIVVLVVAADDGVMPQTVEAINHAKAAKVPLIVAVNKMDKAGADPARVQRELAEHDLAPEDWGGDTIFVQVSAKTGEGIDELLEMISLQAEVLELAANPDKPAAGHVIEARLDAGRGPLATVLVREGTLRNGDPIVCGLFHGKVRLLINDLGQIVDEAGPAVPVEVLGLTGVPGAGDELISLADEKDARQVSEHRTQKQRSQELAKTNRLSLDSLFDRMQEGEIKDLNLILRADVHGSIEALRDSLIKLSNDEVNIQVVHAATGTITESDISLATVSDAIIIGFNVRPNPKVQAMATEEHVDMRFYNIIYNVINDVKNAILGMMASTFDEKTLGRAEVREVYQIPKVGAIAGCYVTDGHIERRCKARVVRDGIVVYEGNLGSLRRFKDDAKEVQTGYECGIGIERFNDIKVGDVIECFYVEEVRPELA